MWFEAAAPISETVGFLPAWYTILPLKVNLSCPLVTVVPPADDAIFNSLWPAFNNKYSYISLDERKKLKLHIDNIKDKINKLLYTYSIDNKEFIDKLNNLQDNYYKLVYSIPENELSDDYHDDVYFMTDAMMSNFDSICEICLNRLDLLIKYLRIDKIENSLGYKILN